MLQPPPILHLFFPCVVIAKGDHQKGEERDFCSVGDSPQIKGSTEDSSQQETLPRSTVDANIAYQGLCKWETCSTNSRIDRGHP